MSEHRKATPIAQPSSLSRFLPPVWSILSMILIVTVLVGGIVIIVYGLGGTNLATGTAPIAVTRIEADAANVGLLGSTPTSAPTDSTPLNETDPDFSLTGPILPTVFLSPTPDVISVGRTVAVINVGESGLNVRAAPGIDSPLVFTANTNSLLEVIAGPQSVPDDSFTWWRVRDLFSNEEGWAVQLYMEVQPESTQP
jgi:hypothetical protein